MATDHMSACVHPTGKEMPNPSTSDTSPRTAMLATDAADVLYTPAATGIASNVAAFLDSLWAPGNATGSALIRFLQQGSGARARGLQDKVREQVSVKDYGAIGDGGSHPLSSRYPDLAAAQVDYPFATSLSDEIDWAAFQSAVNQNAGKGIFVPGGVYVINRAVSITQGSTSVFGSNRLAPIVRTTSATDDIFRIDTGTAPVSGVSIRHLTLDATVAKTDGAGIRVAASTGGTLYWGLFEYIHMSNKMAYGLDVQSAFYLELNEIVVAGVAANKAGLRFAGLNATSKIVNVFMRNIKVVSGSHDVVTIGLLISDHAEGFYASNVSLESAGLDYSLYVANPSTLFGNAAKNLFFHNTITDNASKNGIVIENCQTARFVDVWATSHAGTGIDLIAGTDIELSSVSVIANGLHGIQVGPGVSQLRVLGGCVEANSAKVPNSAAGINVLAGTSSFTLRDIDFLRAGGAPQHYADIHVAAGASNQYIIESNRCLGGVTHRIFDGGTGAQKFIRGNLGFNPRVGNIATPAMAASGVAVTNATGMDVAVYLSGGNVSGIAVSGTLTGLAASPATVVVPAGAFVQVFYSAAPSWKWIGN